MTISFLSARSGQWPGPVLRTTEASSPVSWPQQWLSCSPQETSDMRWENSPETGSLYLQNNINCINRNTAEILLSSWIQFCLVTWEQERLWPRSSDHGAEWMTILPRKWKYYIFSDRPNLCDVPVEPVRYREAERTDVCSCYLRPGHCGAGSSAVFGLDTVDLLHRVSGKYNNKASLSGSSLGFGVWG